MQAAGAIGFTLLRHFFRSVEETNLNYLFKYISSLSLWQFRILPITFRDREKFLTNATTATGGGSTSGSGGGSRSPLSPSQSHPEATVLVVVAAANKFDSDRKLYKRGNASPNSSAVSTFLDLIECIKKNTLNFASNPEVSLLIELWLFRLLSINGELLNRDYVIEGFNIGIV